MTNQQLPTIPHSTWCPQLDASHKRKRADLDESEQVEHLGGFMVHLGRGLQVQQPMYLHSGWPRLQVCLQVPYQHFANYPDDIYHSSTLHNPIISCLWWVHQTPTIFIMLTTTGIPITPHPLMTMIMWMMRTTVVLDRIVITLLESLSCNRFC